MESCIVRDIHNKASPESPAESGTFCFITMKKNGHTTKKRTTTRKGPRDLTVAIQGIATSFHEVAAFTHFGGPVDTVECLSFHALCEALKHGKADMAVMAIENSIAGSILPNYFLLQEYHFAIVGELYLPIHLHLAALPGVKLGDIRTVESHPMAIRQCTEFLQQLQGVSVRESEDTALSAQRIRDLHLTEVAAIANAQAAERFGLQILERRIETHRKNFTRFLVLSRSRSMNPDSNKASLSFEVANEAGSLANVLVVFRDEGINLSKIQSIPIVGRPQEYTIHVDVEWLRRSNYDKAMRQVMRLTRNLNVLGEYKKATIKF